MILVLILVRVIQSILLRSSRLLLGKGRGGGHGHTEPSSEHLDPGSEEKENFDASVLAAPSGKSSAKPWLPSASIHPLAAWHSAVKQRRD